MRTGCPSPETLRSLLTPGLEECAFEKLASHVSECSHCYRRLDDFDTHRVLIRGEAVIQKGVMKPQQATAVGRLSGSSIGQYEIIREIGRGAMGIVFLGFHTELRRFVAVKFLSRSTIKRRRARERFQREVQAAGMCDHKNVVRTTDALHNRNGHFIVMEHVDGIDVESLVNDELPLSVDIACEIAAQIVHGLQHIAENGLVHRDIKPSNLMVSRNGNVRILDLGLAHLTIDVAKQEGDNDLEPSRTNTAESGRVVGTPRFMAPEQWLSVPEIDCRADIYSLGCTLYYLLTGSAPFDGANYSSRRMLRFAHIAIPPEQIQNKNPEIPSQLADVIHQCLAKDP